jgi:hypothetical protein
MQIGHTRKREEVFSGRLIQCACFTVFLPVALVARLSGWRWRPWPPGPSGYGSVIAETRSMARSIAGIAISV